MTAVNFVMWRKASRQFAESAWRCTLKIAPFSTSKDSAFTAKRAIFWTLSQCDAFPFQKSVSFKTVTLIHLITCATNAALDFISCTTTLVLKSPLLSTSALCTDLLSSVNSVKLDIFWLWISSLVNNLRRFLTATLTLKFNVNNVNLDTKKIRTITWECCTVSTTQEAWDNWNIN